MEFFLLSKHSNTQILFQTNQLNRSSAPYKPPKPNIFKYPN